MNEEDIFTNNEQIQTIERKIKKPVYKRTWFIVIMIILAVILFYLIFSITFAYIVVKSGKYDHNLFISENQNSVTNTFNNYDKNIYTENDPSLGDKNAPFQIVEFSDFECPFCSESATIMRELLTKYPQMFHFIYRNFPIDSLHPQARLAAQAGECANDQEKFWQFHDILFANQTNLELNDLLNYAKRVGMNMNSFGDCLSSGKYQSKVQDDLITGINADVKSTPSFFINGDLIEGVIPFEVWEKLVNKYNQDNLK